MNKCVFIGNLTKDPEGGSTSSGISYSRFTIAVNRRYTDSNGDRITDFIPVTAWRGLADNCNKYLVKGNKVAVEGQLNVSTYENDKGERRTKFDISADTVEFLSPRNEDKQPAEDNTNANSSIITSPRNQDYCTFRLVARSCNSFRACPFSCVSGRPTQRLYIH